MKRKRKRGWGKKRRKQEESQKSVKPGSAVQNRVGRHLLLPKDGHAIYSELRISKTRNIHNIQSPADVTLVNKRLGSGSLAGRRQKDEKGEGRGEGQEE